MSYILDTNVYLEIESNNLDVINKLNLLELTGIFHLASPSYSEIYYGLIGNTKEKFHKRLSDLDKFSLLNTSRNSSRIFAELKHPLEKRGRLIPEFDLLIASIVLDNDLVFITRDKHFKEILGLKLILLD